MPKDELQNFRDEVESEFGGLGMQVSIDARGFLTVISPLAGTPAYRAGVQAGDRIIKINGESTEELSLTEAVKKLKGRSGTSVKISIARTGESDPIDLEITREADPCRDGSWLAARRGRPVDIRHGGVDR